MLSKADVTVLGYLAVERRLYVDCLPQYPVEGSTGSEQIPSITNDAPVVALALSQAGVCVDAALNNPGSTSSPARAATDLLQRKTRQLRMGPDCGEPLEIHVIDHGGNRLWFSDPSCGVSSLYSVDVAGLSGRWTYLDAFVWIDATWLRNKLPAYHDGLFINLGKRTTESASRVIDHWVHDLAGKIVVQVSLGPSDVSSAIEWAKDTFENQRAGSLVVTLGASGLVLVDKYNCEFVPGSPVDVDGKVADHSGAGAAVSAAYLREMLASEPMSTRTLAERLALAGARQCQTQGCLDSASREEWLSTLASFGFGSAESVRSDSARSS